jgi:hypothetical protein
MRHRFSLAVFAAVLCQASLATAFMNELLVCCACLDSSQRALSCVLLPEVDQDPFAQSCLMQGGDATCIPVPKDGNREDVSSIQSEFDCAEFFAEAAKPVACPGTGLAASAPLLGGWALGTLSVALVGLGTLTARRRRRPH